MPVIVPYVAHMLRPETEEAVHRQWPHATFVELEKEDEQAYAKLLLGLWSRGEDLTIVEQDIVPPTTARIDFMLCLRPWCAHEVWLGSNYSARTFGLVRFAAPIQRSLPDLMDRATHRYGPGRPLEDWLHLDVMVVRALEFAGIQVHVHRPPAEHLHYPQTEVS